MLRTGNLFFFALSAIATITLLSLVDRTTLPVQAILESPLPKTQTHETVLGLQDQNTPTPPSPVSPALQAPLTILLLGLDARKGDSHPRCDAIHFLTFDPPSQTLRITSVPRGTQLRYAGLPEDTIVANACHTYGVPYTITQLEKIGGVKADYVIKTGFSQAMGILRTMGLPTSPTLLFLRDRHLPLGDYQRSHNQAQFIKDQLVSHFQRFQQMPQLLQYLVFKTVTTDMDYDLANTVLKAIDSFGLVNDPTRIQLVMKPDNLLAFKDSRFPADVLGDTTWKNDDEFQQYQADLETYIQNLIIRANNRFSLDLGETHALVAVAYSQKIWLQIDDENKRDHYYYDLLRLYVLTANDRPRESTLVADFITDMDLKQKSDLKHRGENLLTELTSL